jgi:hypothetical protein
MSVDASKEHVHSIFRIKESAKQEIRNNEAGSRTVGHVPLKCWSTLIGFHVVAARKIELFVIIAVRTSNYSVI